MLWLSLWLLLSQAPSTPSTTASPTQRTSAFLFLLNGTPVGAVDLEWDPARWQFRYVSTHWMHAEASAATQRRSAAFTLDEQGHIAETAQRPAAFWLLHRPGPGCVNVQDELTGEKGSGCVVSEDGARTRGTLLGKPFEALYDDDSGLQELTLGPAQFRRVSHPLSPSTPPDLLGGALPIQGRKGLLAISGGGSIPASISPTGSAIHPVLTPWVESAASTLNRRVHDEVAARSGDQPAECSDYAKAFVQQANGPGNIVRAAVVYGFYAPPDATQARAHAWVVVNTPEGPLELDPALDVPVTRETHLTLGLAGAGNALGSLYLDAFSDKIRVSRRVEPVQPALTQQANLLPMVGLPITRKE
jgi:hypothetical protein